jgi:hypothetical protein
MLAEATWKKFLPIFFGPFLKEYWPTTSILKKPRFQVLLKWFQCIYQAYRNFRSKIPRARVQIPTKNLPHFDAVCDLLECYIPVVLWFEKTKNTDSFELRFQFFRIQLFLLCALDSGPYVKVLFFFQNF